MVRLKSVSKRLQKTQQQTSKQWAKYRKTKLKVNARKDLTRTEKKQILASELDLTRQRISEKFLQYREQKHSLLYKSEIPDFRFTHQLKTTNTIQKIFKAKKNFDTDKLDYIIEQKLEKDKNLQGILVVFEVENEQGLKSYVSNYITRELLERIQVAHEDNWGEGAIYDFVTERLNAGYRENLKLRFIYMRMIYANSKAGNKRN
jgi:hypothetical protein